jgi:CBS domain-containing protein
VIEDGRFVGMVSTGEVQLVPRPLWSSRLIKEVMQSRSDALEISPQSSVMEALEQMMRQRQHRLAVIEDGKLVGLLTRSAMSRLLQLRGLNS